MKLVNVAQRLALAASGRAEIRLESRKKPKPENACKSGRIPPVGYCT